MTPKVCSCLGSCKGADGLAPGYVCALCEVATRFIPKRACEGATPVEAGVWRVCPHPDCGARVKQASVFAFQGACPFKQRERVQPARQAMTPEQRGQCQRIDHQHTPEAGCWEAAPILRAENLSLTQQRDALQIELADLKLKMLRDDAHQKHLEDVREAQRDALKAKCRALIATWRERQNSLSVEVGRIAECADELDAALARVSTPPAVQQETEPAYGGDGAPLAETDPDRAFDEAYGTTPELAADFIAMIKPSPPPAVQAKDRE